MSRRVAVIGMGAVAASGSGVGAFWESLLDGRTGVRPFERYDMHGFPVLVAAPVDAPFEEYCPPCPWSAALEGDPPRRNARLLAAAMAEALLRCGWLDDLGALADAPGGIPVERRGFYVAVRPEEDETSFLLQTRGAARANGRARARSNGGEATSAVPPTAGANPLTPRFPLEVAGELGLRGPHLMLHDACTTGTALLGEALHDLREGRADLALVAAANADLHLDTLCHYTLLSALSPNPSCDACRPFDAKRDGSVRAEGAAAVVLQAWDAGGGEPVPAGALAEVVGYGASADAHRPTGGHPEERGLVLAIEQCLRDAGVEPAAVEHVNAHGTGVPMNDLHEARALHRALGERAAKIPLTANKAVTGHASFASGLLEAIATVRTLRSGRIPPTAHYRDPDPDLPPLDIVAGGPRAASIRTALSLSSGFGGLNAAVLLRRLDPAEGR